MDASRIQTAFLTATAGVYEQPGAPDHVVTVHARGRIEASIQCDGRTLRRRQAPGDIDLIPAGADTRVVDEGPSSILALLVPRGLVEAQFEEFGRAPASPAPLFGVRDEGLADLAWRLHARRDSPHGLYDECLAQEFARRLVWRHDPRRPTLEAELGPLEPRRLRRALEMIEDRLDEPIRVADLAAAAGVGLTTFKVGFRQALGAPVHRYIVRRRAERARLMLLEGRLPPAQVALEAGFAHQTHMARWMRRLFGALPSDFRDA